MADNFPTAAPATCIRGCELIEKERIRPQLIGAKPQAEYNSLRQIERQLLVPAQPMIVVRGKSGPRGPDLLPRSPRQGSFAAQDQNRVSEVLRGGAIQGLDNDYDSSATPAA